MGAHLIDGEFQSDKYPTTPRGKVPLSVKDKTAQGLLWEYAQRRRAVDAEFSDDLEAALKLAGFVPPASAGPRRSHEFMCKIGADSQDALVRDLHLMAHDIERGELTAGVSGGYSSGSVYAYRHDPRVTHDSYFAELDAALEKRRRGDAP